jgi:hypothetical protein
MPIPDRERAYFLREAEAFARVIVAWHRELGLNMAPGRLTWDGKIQQETLDQYRSAVSRFIDSDLRTLEAQAEVARTQLSGIFEGFYREEIPASFWGRFAEGLQFHPPTHLFEAARRIHQLHERIAAIEDPKEEPPQQIEESGRGTSVRYSSRDELRSLARQHYAPYLGEEYIGIGGANFLLSSSLERSAEHSAESGEITLLKPEYLGFEIQHSADPNDLLSRLRAGEVRIESLEGF